MARLLTPVEKVAQSSCNFPHNSPNCIAFGSPCNDGIIACYHHEDARLAIKAMLSEPVAEQEVNADPVWPSGCKDTGSCERHKQCMYVNCIHEGKDIVIPLTVPAGSTMPASAFHRLPLPSIA